MFVGALLLVVAVSSAKEVVRTKRQFGNFYNCGSFPNTYYSSSPCISNYRPNCGFGYSAPCIGNGLISSAIGISQINPYSSCYGGCGGINCGMFTGNYLNGQYAAYAIGTNQYNQCASICCGQQNIFPQSQPYQPYDGLNGNRNGILGQLLRPNNGQCGGTEEPLGPCITGHCPEMHHCVKGLICCPCLVGASNGRCANGHGCSAGYTCAQNGFCCAALPFGNLRLQTCNNGQCADGYICGIGDLCYPKSGLGK